MGVLAVVGLLAFGVISKGSGALEVGETVPTASLGVLADDVASGETGSVSDYRGRWVLLNVWASWCVPCRDETPLLQDLQDAEGDNGFTVFGVNSQDGSADALEFEDEFGVSYPSVRDGSGDYAEELGATGVPESILIDPEGKVADYRPGPVTEDYIDSVVLPKIGAS